MQREGPLRVLIVGEFRLHRDALAGALRGEASFDVVGTAAPLDAPTLVVELEPDVVLLDLDESRARRTARMIRERSPAVGLLVLGEAHSQEDALSWAEAGVLTWTGRDAALAELVAALEGAPIGYDSSLTITLVRRFAELPLASRDGEIELLLTRREEQILELIGERKANKEIAQILILSRSTVKNHVHSIIRKLRVSSRREAVERARELKARALGSPRVENPPEELP